jgi:tight adherence protein B
MFEFDTIYLVYGFVGVSAMMLAEAVYLLGFSAASYRKRINHRLALLNDTGKDRGNILVQLRRERGLTREGGLRLPMPSFNRLVLQSGVTIGFARLALLVVVSGVMTTAGIYVLRDDVLQAMLGGLFALTIAPYLVLRMKRGRRQKKFGAQFPDALDIIVRSLRAGHPVPIAVSMVAREMTDPIGSEFGVVADEITYGADLETAMRSLFFRVGQDDLPLFVTAVAIQGSTGGNLGEILENLSAVIRQRFKMRRKIKALASEGRASAIILSSLPILMFGVVQLVSPDFYGSVWKFDITRTILTIAICWMLVGNFIMYKLVNFKI